MGKEKEEEKEREACGLYIYYPSVRQLVCFQYRMKLCPTQYRLGLLLGRLRVEVRVEAPGNQRPLPMLRAVTGRVFWRI
jgi:hypothetical protein